MQLAVRHTLQLFDPDDASQDEAGALVLPVRQDRAVMGETVDAYLQRVAWRFDLPTVCRINGEYYSRAEWATRAVGMNDNLEFVSRPLGSSSSGASASKSIMAIVAMVALTAIAGPVGGAFAGAAQGALGFGSFAYAVAASLASAVIVGASAAPIAAWLAPPAPWWRRTLRAARVTACAASSPSPVESGASSVSAINALVRRDRIHFWTDGAVWEPDGRISGTQSKVHLLPQAHAAVALRGHVSFVATFVAILGTRHLTGFDDLVSTIPGAAADAASIAGPQRADIVVAGWSHDRGCGELWKLDTSQPNARLEPQGEGFIMPGENPELFARLQRAGWNMHHESQDEERLLELMEHQRAVDDHLPNGARFPTVGGFAQATTITADGISTRIVRRWPIAQAA